MKVAIWIFIAVFTVSSTSFAVESIDRQAWSDFTTPVSTDARYVFYMGATLAVSLAILEDQISDPLQREVVQSRPLGNLASDLGKLQGALIPNIAYTLGMIGYSMISKDNTSRDRGNLMFRATVYAQSLTTALKYIVREERPDHSEKVSFPSGHTTGAFSFASVIGTEHAWYWGALAYSYATVVAYGRMNDNRHFLHDVIAGATVGASYGFGLYLRQHRDRTADSPEKSEAMLNLLPTERADGLVVGFTKNF